ncbi:MAG: metallophosphoesterase [Lachnospiraceae bacterium]|nr:metallophosphoesterase [Lachnospiraceae bacterium]
MGSIGKEIAKEAARTVAEQLTGELNEKVMKKIELPVKLGMLGAAAASAFIAVSAHERDTLTYARYDVDSFDKAGDNVRLLFLTDLHEKQFGQGNSGLLEYIDAADPDAVLIGGDMIIADKHNKKKIHTKVTTQLCRDLTAKYPVFYAEGNHEQRLAGTRFRQQLESMGVTYLTDQTVEWKYNLSFTGLNLDKTQYRPIVPGKPDVQKTLEHLGGIDPKRYNVMLAHSPLFMESYTQMGADLVLSGHFHGGTIRLPGNVGLMTPQYQFFNTNVVGMKQIDHTFMIISSGLGTHSVNLRINNKPQVVVVDIKK